MQKKQSAGILIYSLGKNPFHVNVNNTSNKETLYLLGHYGGPFFENKDLGTWTIPKGEVDPDEDIQQAAIRELEEETGISILDKDTLIALGSVKQKSGKIIHAWAYQDQTNISTATLKSNLVELEFPKGSGKKISFPEMDRYEYFTYEQAIQKINSAQKKFLDELQALITTNQIKNAKNI